MTHTLVFRITREIWDALERGEKTVEYRDSKPFWDCRMVKAMQSLGFVKVEALFIEPPRWSEEGNPRDTGMMRFSVRGVVPIDRGEVPERWRSYLTTPEVWAVELGERLG